MTHTECLSQLNFKTLLQEIPQGKDFCLTGNGHIMKRSDDSTTQPARNRLGESRVVELDRMPTQTKTDCGTTSLGNYDNLKSVATAETSPTYNAALQGLTNNSARPLS